MAVPPAAPRHDFRLYALSRLGFAATCSPALPSAGSFQKFSLPGACIETTSFDLVSTSGASKRKPSRPTPGLVLQEGDGCPLLPLGPSGRMDLSPTARVGFFCRPLSSRCRCCGGRSRRGRAFCFSIGSLCARPGVCRGSFAGWRWSGCSPWWWRLGCGRRSPGRPPGVSRSWGRALQPFPEVRCGSGPGCAFPTRWPEIPVRTFGVIR